MTTTTVAASAPGKVILFGEHAVVHSQPAIAASLDDLRIYAVIRHEEVTSNGMLTVNMPNFKKGLVFRAPTASCLYETNITRDVAQGVVAPTSDEVQKIHKFIRKAGASHSSVLRVDEVEALTPLFFMMNGIIPALLNATSSLSLYVRSEDLPLGAGLGSSAAFCVACSAALYRLREKTGIMGVAVDRNTKDNNTRPERASLDIINAWAFASEGVIHGNPSGLDNTVSCYGGAVYYQKDAETGNLRAFHELVVPPLDMILTNTFIPRSTKALVAGVHKVKEDFEFTVDVFAAIGRISDQFRKALDPFDRGYRDTAKISQLIRTNQSLLKAIGVSHQALDEICHITEQMGVASKLTGAGGGGCAFTYVPPDCKYTRDEIREKIEESPHGFKCLSSLVGGTGVRYMNPDTIPSVDLARIRKQTTDKSLPWDRTLQYILALGSLTALGFVAVGNMKKK
mmetsp:Transcript_16478/g.25737  ORF Transcript_16478/g.25737 Transcript_16478/m.25737 type:complete len:455 (-) Transcript_16478:236-1600(-)